MGCFVHRFLISSPNLRIDAGFSLFPPSFMHRFLISGPDLRIDASFSLFPPSFMHRFLITGPDLRIDASFSPFTPSFVHRFLISGPDLRITAGFCLGMVSPATGIEDAGGDWYHEGGIILSKKPPEWHRSPPLHEFRVRFKFLCSKGEWPACSVHGGNGLPHPILIFVTAKKNGPPATTSLLHGRTARL